MIGRFGRNALTGVLALALLGGCASPCDDLANQTCKRVGERDALCVQLRTIAAQPQAGDEEACKAGVAFVRELERR